MTYRKPILLAAVMATFLFPALRAQCPPASAGALPLRYSGPATVTAITPCDLMTRLYIFADDSMRGRRAGTDDNVRATSYIAREAARLGLKPAGDSGTYFQDLPMVTRALDTSSTIVVAGRTLHAGIDFIATTAALHPADLSAIKLVYGGTLLDTTVTLPADAADQLVLFRPIPQAMDAAAVQRTPRGTAWVTWYNTIHNRATANAAQLSPQALRVATAPATAVMLAERGATISLTLTSSAAETLFGASLDSVRPGTYSKPFTLNLRYHDVHRPTRNVIAVLPGGDPHLRTEYVALGAHSDHLGMARAPIDHDSLRVFNQVSRAGTEGAASRKQTTEDDEYDRIHVLTDSLHRTRPVRRDSVFNGADDGGSGTVALLEIAEQLAREGRRPKRSILFVWHTATEGNPALAGSAWFTDHPTVPRDSIVAELMVDMIGRGEAQDEIGITSDESPRHGNPDLLEVVGARRRSAELARMIESANVGPAPLKLDYSADAAGHPEGLACRSDNASYARYGIPSAFFTTGYHADYREVTDEPQYIQYSHMARVTQLVARATSTIANLDHRLTADGPKPDPAARCIQ